jgi:uncharacterized caspase-like protein/tetratricopeptide (TPR) repeat protein
MKKIILVLLLFSASVAHAQAKTWALLVGVSSYQNPQISTLRYAAQDATGLRDALIDAKLGGLPENQVLLLADDKATREGILGAVQTFLKPNVKAGDHVIVFLAGHGVAKGVGVGAKSFLLPSNVKGLTTAALESSAVDLRALSNELGALPAAQFVVFVDACREDPTPGRGIKGNTMNDVLSRGVHVVPQSEKAQSATFFACSVGQRAYEDATLGHGVFTNWILDGLRAGAVPQQPDGAVDMGRLSSYVATKVSDWAKKTSAAGDFEVEQTPELVATQLSQPLVLLRVKRPLSAPPIAPAPPKLLVAAFPEGAQVSINGQRAGSGVVEKDLPTEGDYQVTVSAPGYAPVARSVKALGGYQNQIVVQLQSEAPAGPAADFYKRAVEAEGRQQWEVAEQGYSAAIGADAKFMPAHEALIDLFRQQGRNGDAIAASLNLLGNARNVHTLSVLSRAYSRFAQAGAGNGNTQTSVKPVVKYVLPRKPEDAVKLAQNAATEALALDANSAEANRAQGYALAALDAKGKNESAAKAAFGKAIFLDGSDAANHLGLGYAIRFYASQKEGAAQKNEIERAIPSLKQALALRPNYYEAHRELAFCYTMLGDSTAALRECELANANRGAASDTNEIVALELTAAGMHRKAAENSTGDKKTAHEQASDGYVADAKETSPDLKVALQILNSVGVSTSLASYLPRELTPLLDIRGTVEGKIRDKIKIPGLRFP